MRSLLRGLAGGLLVLGLAALTPGPGKVAAQAKKDPAKKEPAPAKKPDDKAKDETGDKRVGISTSDGLSLNAYWYQGNALEKNPPDAVLMFPAPGDKVTDSWIALAKALSEKNFSVLLMDWRGCGMNSPAAPAGGPRIIAEKEAFWREIYNSKLLKPQRAYEDKGLDYKAIIGKNEGSYRYRDFLFNDLLAARFYLDRQNDNGKCNSGRIWLVTEKDGGQMALAFIASEFPRNSIYETKFNQLDTGRQVRSAGKDYVGLTCLSYAGGNSTASAVWNNSLKAISGQLGREATDYFEHRLAMIMEFGKKEGPTGSRQAFSMVHAGGDEEALKKNYKYLRQIDNSKIHTAVSGIGLIDPMDSFGAKADIQNVMVAVSKVMPQNKERLDRDANKKTDIPRFPAETLGVRR